ncbi:MAG: HAD hydrolase-like protein [Oligoflexales bacterium]|nr:HAD hydrolase-like protein [Oligoflexales bacterium]
MTKKNSLNTLPPPVINLSGIIGEYELLLIDAFGVLMNMEGALPGAVNFIKMLHDKTKPYFIVTNACFFDEEGNSRNYKQRGFDIPPENIISSGSLIPRWTKERREEGKDVFYVLGPESTKDLVRKGGGNVLPFVTSELPHAIVLGHQEGYPFVEGIDRVISMIFRALDSGQDVPPILVPNTDIIYPKSEKDFGITGGSLGVLVEAAIKIRFPDLSFSLEHLGKPKLPLFNEAKRRVPGKKTLMMGDQMHTDIQGAVNAGIDSVLMGSGVSDLARTDYSGLRPTYIMPNLLT